MPYPIKKTNHTAEGLSWLTSRMKLPNMRAVLASYLNRVQDLENVIWDVIASQQLALSPTGKSLEQLADLVGEVRGLFTDVQLLLWIKVIIRALHSAGLSEDLIQVAALALGKGATVYQDFPPAAFEMTAWNINGAYAPPLARALHLARDPGVLGALSWSNWPASQNIVLPDGFNKVTGQGFADPISGQFAFKLGGATQI